MYLLLWAWLYIGIHSPVLRFLVSHEITGAAFWAILYPLDTLTNMLLCIPAAYLLCKLRPSKLGLYLIVAILPSFLWLYRLLLGSTVPGGDWLVFLPGALMTVLPLPVTSLIFRKIVLRPADVSAIDESRSRGL